MKSNSKPVLYWSNTINIGLFFAGMYKYRSYLCYYPNSNEIDGVHTHNKFFGEDGLMNKFSYVWPDKKIPLTIYSDVEPDDEILNHLKNVLGFEVYLISAEPL